MKAILISIKPKWVAKILNGEKTIEIRKTIPKCDLPVEVYIYCTKDSKTKLASNSLRYYAVDNKEYKNYMGNWNGKVVAKFTLNKVEEMFTDENGMSYYTDTIKKDYMVSKLACLDDSDIYDYLGNNIGYAWHISNLEIFDKPKEVSEFKKNNSTTNCWKCKLFGSGCSTCQLTKAPQSWCYVEGGK